MYPSNDVITNLMNGGKDAKNFDAVAVSDGDEVFLQHNDYFVDNGDNRKQVTISLPTTSTDGARIMVLDAGGAFTNKFVLNTTFHGAVIADGKMYNMADNEQVDREKYIFLKTDELFMNVFKIDLSKEEQHNEIPANSLIYFERNSLRYYALNSEKTKYIYHEITGIDLKNEVTIDERKMSYGDLIQRLGVWRDNDDEEEIPEEIVPEEEKPAPPSGGSSGYNEKVDKMEVSAKFVSADTYVATFMFNIHDPNGEIVRYPTVEILEGGKTYARKTFYSSSNASEIIGLKPETHYTYKIYFTYKNEEKLFQSTLDEGEFTTLNMDGIEAIDLSFDDVTARSNDATISNLRFKNNVNDRVLKGLSKFVVVIDGQEVKFGSSAISTFRTGGSLNYTTPGILKSNTIYHFEFRAYDVAGNRLSVLNNGVDLKTVKVPPTAKLTVKESDFTWFKAEASIDNPDDVHMENLRYVLLDGDAIIREEALPNNRIIHEVNLSDNKVYQLLIYADYDLNDGNGNQRNKLLTDTYVATTSIAMLGNLRLVLNKNAVTKDAASFDMKINTRTTDNKLIELLNQLVIYVDDENGETVIRKEISGLEMQTLRAGNAVNLSFNELNSNTEYTIRGEAKFNQGDVEYDVEVVLSIRSFHTMKKPAVVEVIDDFTTSSMIDYTVRVVDPDGSITSNRVIMNVERVNGNTLGIEDLEINGDYKRFSFNKLDNNVTYEVSFTAEGYNEGFTDATYISGKVLLVKQFTTEDGVDGSIALESLLRQRTGKNHYEIKNLQRWKDVSLAGSDSSTTTDRSYDLENDVTYLSVKNGDRYYSYFLPELIGKQVTVSFDAKIETAGSAEFLARVANNDSAITSCTLTGLNNKYQHYRCTFTVGAKGYIGFYLKEVSAQNRLTQIAIRKLQIEEGGTETSYEPYQGKTAYLATTRTSLVDAKRETTNNDYYIKVYRFGELVEEIRCPLDENGVATDAMTEFDVDMNSNYSLWLAVRINGVDYNIANTEFTTEAEIRSIRTLDEFKNMHIAGKYYVINDIDFQDQGRLYKNFYGIIDFQGNRIDLDNKKGEQQTMFGNFYGTLKNVDYHVHLNAPSSSLVRHRWGLTEYNYGLMQNVFVTIDESISGSTYYGISTMARYNFGTIDTFVIHMKVSMYGIHSFSPFVLENYGTIRNGYAYADEGAKLVTYYNRAYESNPKYVGVFAARERGTGRLENVYSLIDIDSSAVVNADGSLGRLEIVGNLVGAADAGATISHVYSNADGENRNLTTDINWAPTTTYNSANYHMDNMYYVLSDRRIAAGEDYKHQGSTRISPWALRNVSFQDNTLNSYSAFDVDSFVKYGYYPHIIFPEVMPKQDYILLPIVTERELPDVVNVVDIQQDDNSSATVTFNVRNYYQLNITSIEIDKLTTEIIEQTHKDHYTTIVVKVKNPTQYLSAYSIMSISNGNIRTYGTNERIVNVEMYREIKTTQDWANINSKRNENYRLMNDIDFINKAPATFRITSNFTGKIDGNGFTVRNMLVDSGNAAIESNYGTIMNLYIENYTKRTINAYGGFISTLQRGGRIVNVHMKNAEILGTTYVGGLVGLMDSGVIQNSSVSGVKLYNITASSAQTIVGGLVGRIANSSTIQNSFVTGIDFDIRQAPNVYAIGGIVGQVSSTGAIDNVYAEGKIQTKTPSNGGIIGQAENYGSLTHAISYVDIFSSSNFDIGGIIGEVTNPSHFIVSNTLSAGAIYSSLSGGTVRRILGGDIVISLPNFAWHDQHINGIITEETSGESLVSTEELNVVDNYVRVMEMGDAFSYDEIGDNSLPLLYALDSTDLLPNQEKLYLKKYDFEVEHIEARSGVDSQGNDNAWIYMEISNPDGVEITDITIDDVTVKQVTQNSNQDETTFIRMEVTPIYYYDSYRLSGITYKSGEETVTVSKDTKVEMQFFRDLWSVADWQRIDPVSSENYRLRANIDFTGVDINRNLFINRLEGFENGFTLSNITINGSGSNVGLLHAVNSSLYNVSFDHVTITNSGSGGNNTGIVLFGYGRAEKLVFNDIKINATGTSYVGIVADNFESDMRNLTIKNSEIKGSSRVGGYAGRTKPFSVTGVNIEDVKVTGSSTLVGGFAGDQWQAPVLIQYDIVAKHVTVSGTAYVGGIYGRGAGNNLKVTKNDVGELSTITGTKSGDNSYVGGISGYVNSTATMTNNTVDNTKISATGYYLGGITGYSDRSLTASTVKGVTIDGKNRVGGIAGAVNGNYSVSTSVVGGDDTADKVKITNTGNGTGGICGYYCSVSSCVVNNVEINSDGTYTGGINGYSYSVTASLVRNTKITGNSYVGGVAGTTNGYTLQTSTVVNTEVKGSSQVGGLLGGSAGESGSFTYYQNNTVNATKVEATGNDAGGLIGYLNNKEYSTTIQSTTTYYYRRRAYNNIIENTDITANSNAGGLIGRIEVSTVFDGLQPDRIYGNVIAASSVATTNASKDPGVMFGNDDNLAYSTVDAGVLRMTKTKVYENMKLVKGTAEPILAKNYTGNNFDVHSDKASKMATLNDLKTQTLYTGLGHATSVYNYGQLSNSKFPYIKAVDNLANVSTDQILVNLPSALTTNSISPSSFGAGRMMTRGFSYHAMPEYTIYPVNANTINVEFSNLDEQTTFTINGVEYPIDNRTFSFNYNFDADIEFEMTDGTSTKTKTYKPEELRGTLAVVGNNYYILNNGRVISNDYQNEVTALNIMGNEILTDDGRIIDLMTNEVKDVEDTTTTWIGTAIPIYEYDSNGSNVKVFAKYSVVDDLNVIEKQVFSKGVQTEIINPSINNAKYKLVMDSYNNKDYLTVLGTDNTLYDLKTALEYPDNFSKEGIVDISSNYRDFSHFLAVRYETGKVVVFDYRTGNVVYKIQPEEVPTPLEYFVQQVTTNNEKMYDEGAMEANLQTAENMKSTIASGTVVSPKNNISANGNYVTSYDPIKDEYEIYETGELLKQDPLGATALSVSDKIYGDNTLNTLFGGMLSHDRNNNVAITIVYVGIGVTIMISMVALGDLLRKKV